MRCVFLCLLAGSILLGACRPANVSPLAPIPLVTSPQSAVTPTAVAIMPDELAAAPGQILFTSNWEGNSEIYSVRPDGSELKNLTYNSAFDYWPSWSTVARRLAFVSDRGNDWQLHTMSMDGSQLKALPEQAGYVNYPAWSPDGRELAFVYHPAKRTGFATQLHIMDMNAPATVKNLTPPDMCDFLYAWSPDGSQLAVLSAPISPTAGSAYAYAFDLYTMRSDGSDRRQLTRELHLPVVTPPQWSPDGTRIAFMAYVDDDNVEIFVVNADGTHLANLTNNSAPDHDPVWSPDGSALLFASNRAGDQHNGLYLMRPDGSNVMRLTEGAEWADQPTWSPDGQWLAYVSFITPRTELRVMRVATRATYRVTDLHHTDDVPPILLWIP